MSHRICRPTLVAAIIITLLVLLRSLDVGPRGIEYKSLAAISKLAPDSWQRRPPSVTKVTALFAENELYEAAIHSHDEHDRSHNYGMKVLRERIVQGYWSKPTYLLALVVQELAKPVEERTEWFMWLGADVILLNPHVPLEIFLPPDDFSQYMFLGTHDADQLDCGVFFLRAHEWSVEMLLEVLNLPRDYKGLKESSHKDQFALQTVLSGSAYRERVLFQPRSWYNTFQRNDSSFEGKQGDLLVHFHDMEGDQWSAMATMLEGLRATNGSAWRVPLAETGYERETEAYWTRMRESRELLAHAKMRLKEPGVDEAVKRLEYRVTYNMDHAQGMQDAMQELSSVLHR